MNSIKSILYITILTASYNAFGMIRQLHHNMSAEEAQNTINMLRNVENHSHNNISTKKHNFPQLSEKEQKEKDILVKRGLEFIPGKDHERYFQDMTNIYLNNNLRKSDPIVYHMTKKEFYKKHLLPRRHST